MILRRPASYRCLDPLTIIAVAGMAYSGYSSMQAGNEQKKQYEEQAQIAQEEANTQATQKEAERRKMLANQRMAYLANGVSLSGTPLIVGDETSREYQMEIDALRRSGVNQANSLNAQGDAAQKSGRTQLITSLAGGAGIAAKGGIFSSKTNTTSTLNRNPNNYPKGLG